MEFVLVPREIFFLRAVEREYSRDCVQIDHGHGPDVAGFLHGIDVGIEIFPAPVGVVLVRLDVGLAEFSVASVKRSHQDDLLLRVHILQ